MIIALITVCVAAGWPPTTQPLSHPWVCQPVLGHQSTQRRVDKASLAQPVAPCSAAQPIGICRNHRHVPPIPCIRACATPSKEVVQTSLMPSKEVVQTSLTPSKEVVQTSLTPRRRRNIAKRLTAIFNLLATAIIFNLPPAVMAEVKFQFTMFQPRTVGKWAGTVCASPGPVLVRSAHLLFPLPVTCSYCDVVLTFIFVEPLQSTVNRLLINSNR